MFEDHQFKYKKDFEKIESIECKLFKYVNEMDVHEEKTTFRNTIYTSIAVFLITIFFLSQSSIFTNRKIYPESLIKDIQNFDNNSFYGKPLVTIGVIPFGVTTELILKQFQVSLGTWLRGTSQIQIYAYDVVGGMGPLAPTLISSLQTEFGEERIKVKGKIIKQFKIETIPEAFAQVERDCETQFCAFASNDIILRHDWIDMVYATRKYFGNYNNYSMHFPRRDLFESCRSGISLDNIFNGDSSRFLPNSHKYYVNSTQEYIKFMDTQFVNCKSRIHTVGYDVYLWNIVGINMTKANISPYYIGRPHFDFAIMRRQMDQGWFITTFPDHFTYHYEHPDRKQYAKRRSHPDSQYNLNLQKQDNLSYYRNEYFNFRINGTHIIFRGNNSEPEIFKVLPIEDNSKNESFVPFSNINYSPDVFSKF